MRNRMDPNYVYTAEELEAIAAKDRLAKQHREQRISPLSIGKKILAVGVWKEPNDWEHRNYCGAGATQVALDARLPYWEVPDIETVADELDLDPDSGSWVCHSTDPDIRDVLNDRLDTDWYWCSGSGSGNTLYNRIVWDMDHDYALVTGCETDEMDGWGGHHALHIVAVYGYWEPTGSTQYVYYTETSGSVAGYDGPYRQRATRQEFWTYVDGNDAQAW